MADPNVMIWYVRIGFYLIKSYFPKSYETLWVKAGLNNLVKLKKSLTFNEFKNTVIISYNLKGNGIEIPCTHLYKINSDSIDIQNQIIIQKNVPNVPRIGL